MDSQLTPKGVRQARLLARRLRHWPVDKIYSSDLGRAYATTLEIAKYLKVRIIRDPALREIHLGDWEGMTPEEVDRLYDRGYEKWLRKPSACVIPRGEGLGHFRKRIVGRVRAIARANRGKTVLLVTHGGAITAMLAEWLEADFDHLLLNLHLENTSLTLVNETDKRARLLSVNDSSHLSPRERNDRFVLNAR